MPRRTRRHLQAGRQHCPLDVGRRDGWYFRVEKEGSQGRPIIGPRSAPPLLNVTAKVRRDFIFSSSFMSTPSHSWYILNLSRPISPSIPLFPSPSFSLHIYVYIPPVDSILHVHLFSLPSAHLIEGEDELKRKPAVGFLPTLPAFHFLKPLLLLTFPVSLSF